MKKNILILIIGIIIGSMIGAAAYSYTAKQVRFTPNDKEWDVDNVSDAINSLEEQNEKYKSVNITHCNGGMVIFTNLITKYSKFMLVNVGGTSTNYKMQLQKGSDNTVIYDGVELNKEYNTSEFEKSYVMMNDGYVCFTMKFYN